MKIAFPYIPLSCTPIVGDPNSKGGYYWEGKIVPFEEADSSFWEEVERKYPTTYMDDEDITVLMNEFQNMMKTIDDGYRRRN